jgi:hypothetical protein
MKKELIVELIWIIGLAMFTTIAFTLFWGFDKLTDKTIDLSFHDTYFVITPFIIITPTFLSIAFLTTGIRLLVNRGKILTINISFIILTGLLIIFISIFIKDIQGFKLSFDGDNKGWMVYPPANNISPKEVRSDHGNISGIDNLLLAVQIFLVMTLVIISVVTGKSSGRHSAEHRFGNSPHII